jgi:DNA-binding NarL/FixJ family response regulator
MCDDLHVAVSVLIVDDHSTFRASARTLLELEGFDVVGEASDGESGLSLAREIEPDVVLLDVALPDVSGFEVAEQLADARCKVILISSREPNDFGQRPRRSGALGFIAKDRLSGPAVHALLTSVP